MAVDDDFVSLAPKDAPPTPSRPMVGYAGDNDIQPVNRPGILSTSYNNVPREGSNGSIWDDLQRKLALGTRGAFNAVTSLPAAAVDALTWPGRVALRGAGYNVTAPSDLLQQDLTAGGLPVPETAQEKRDDRLIQAGGSMLTPLGIGMAPKVVAGLPNVVRPLLAPPATPMGPGITQVPNLARPAVLSGPRAAGQVVAGGAGAEAGEVVAERPEVPDWLKPTARMATDMGVNSLVSGLTGVAGTIKNAFTGTQSDIAQALERLGIKPGTVGAVSERPTVQSAEAAMSRSPIASDIVQPGQQRTIDQFDEATRRTALSLHPATTAQQAGEAVQKALHDWKTVTFRAEQDAAWLPLNQRMAGSAVDPTPFRRALEATAKDPRLNSLPETQKAFANATIQKWLTALEADVGRGASLSWEQAQAIKSSIGDMMGTPDIVASIGGTAMKRIYGGLAEGMEATATQHGQGRLFQDANKVTIDGHQFIDGTMSKGVSANNLSQETIRADAAARALLNDNAAMQQLRERVPAAADALAAYKLHISKEARPSSQTDASTPSTGTFLTEMRKHQLMYPEGSRALFSDPQAKQNLEDLLATAAQLRRTEKNVNTSNTTQAAIWSTLPAQIVGGYSMAGLPGAIGLPVATMAGFGTGGKALTNPALIALAAARRGQRLPFHGLLGGALSDIAAPPLERKEGR